MDPTLKAGMLVAWRRTVVILRHARHARHGEAGKHEQTPGLLSEDRRTEVEGSTSGDRFGKYWTNLPDMVWLYVEYIIYIYIMNLII